MRPLTYKLLRASSLIACVVSLAGGTGARARAQVPQAPAAPARDARTIDIAPSGTASIAGAVVDVQRHPLRRSSVTITGPVTRVVVTDDNGRFAFGSLPAGRYTIVARKPGYPQMSYGAKQPFRTG